MRDPHQHDRSTRIITALFVVLSLAASVLFAPSTSEAQEAESGTIGGTVWIDLNSDGIRQDDEPVKQGIGILLESNNFFDGAQIVGEVETDEFGRWSFDVPPNGYQAFFDKPGSSFYTRKSVGDDRDRDSDIASVGVSDLYRIAAGQDVVVDAGILPIGTIDIVYWVDTNRNGIRDSNEPIGPNTGATLSPVDDPDQVIDSMRFALADFEGLDFGTYELTVVPLDSWSFTAANQGENEATDSDIDPVTGQLTMIVDAPRLEQTVTVGLLPDPVEVRVVPYEDLNLNGIRDEGEPGLAPDLLLTNDLLSEPISGTIEGDASVFTNVDPGAYQVILTPEAQASGLRFVGELGPINEFRIAVLAATTTEVLAPMTTTRPVGIALDDAQATVDLRRAGSRFQTITGNQRFVFDGVTGANTIDLSTPAGIEITDVVCSGGASELERRTPADWQWTLTITTAIVDIECTIETARTEIATLTISQSALSASRVDMFFASAYRPFDVVEFDNDSPRDFDLNPGTYAISLLPFFGGLQPALVCIGAQVNNPQDNRFEIEVTPGSTPTCVVHVVDSPDRWFVIINGNAEDIVIPHTGQTRSPNVTFGDAGSPRSSVPASQLADWSTDGTIEASLQLAPGEEPSSIACTGVTSLTTAESFDSSTGSNVIDISGNVLGATAVCTFTTVQRVFGDVDCDGALTILDGYIIAQHAVGSRPDNALCPTQPGAGQITLTTGDTDDNQVVNILDAFRVAQCSVDIANSLCPADN